MRRILIDDNEISASERPGASVVGQIGKTVGKVKDNVRNNDFLVSRVDNAQSDRKGRRANNNCGRSNDNRDVRSDISSMISNGGCESMKESHNAAIEKFQDSSSLSSSKKCGNMTFCKTTSIL